MSHDASPADRTNVAHAPSSVPVFILAGGLGTRISEETGVRPKPMIEIGDTPILVHIMRWYHAHGFDDFVICAGYRSWDIKSYFLDYALRANDLEIDRRASLAQRPHVLGDDASERWRVRVIDTGANAMTGARIARALDLVSRDTQFTTFAVTYGDGVCDVDLGAHLAYHRAHGRIGTVLGVPPLSRWGTLDVDDHAIVRGFREKPPEDTSLVNGGFFFFEPAMRARLSHDASCTLEQAPLAGLAADGQLVVNPHRSFWHPMDTLRDKTLLNALWEAGDAPWHPSRATSQAR